MAAPPTSPTPVAPVAPVAAVAAPPTAPIAFTEIVVYPLTPGARTIRVKYTLARAAWVHVQVVAPDGTVVRSLGNVRAVAGKQYGAMWYGKDKQGRIAPLRHYTIMITAEDGGGITVVKKPITMPTPTVP